MEEASGLGPEGYRFESDAGYSSSYSTSLAEGMREGAVTLMMSRLRRYHSGVGKVRLNRWLIVTAGAFRRRSLRRIGGMVDALASGASEHQLVRVQVPCPARMSASRSPSAVGTPPARLDPYARPREGSHANRRLNRRAVNGSSHTSRACSAVGSAPRSQRGGHGFDSRQVHWSPHRTNHVPRPLQTVALETQRRVLAVLGDSRLSQRPGQATTPATQIGVAQGDPLTVAQR